MMGIEKLARKLTAVDLARHGWGNRNLALAESGEPPLFFSLLIDIKRDPISGEALQIQFSQAVRDVLVEQCGLGERMTNFLVTEIARKSRLVDRILPHWVFVSILNRMVFGNCYQLASPERIRHKTPEVNPRVPTRPVLASTIIPVCSNFGSSMPCRPAVFHERLSVFLRPRLTGVAQGFLSFPGGRSDNWTELTGTREFLEELDSLRVLVGDRAKDLGETPRSRIRRVDFLAMVDQSLISDGEKMRFLNYVFVYWLAFPYVGGGPNCYFGRLEETLKQTLALAGDGQGDWQPHLLDTNGEIIGVNKKDLSPIAQIGMKALRKRFFGVELV